MAFVPIITTAGLALLNDAANGAGALELTQVKAGDGVLGETDPLTLTDLISVVQEGLAVDSRQDEAGDWYAYVELSNAGLEAGYLRREMGLYAQLAGDSETETLLVYWHAEADSDADYIPPLVGAVLVTVASVKITLAAGLDVTVTLDQSGVYLSLDRWASHLGGVGGADQHASGSLAQPGDIKATARTTAPDGWLECNGAEISRTTYAALFSAIGETWGAGNGTTTFKVPDLRGEFIRGWDHGRGIDTDREIATLQSDAVEDHQHETPLGKAYNLANPPDQSPALAAVIDVETGTADTTEPATGNMTAATGGGETETRPRNVSMMYCIKY